MTFESRRRARAGSVQMLFILVAWLAAVGIAFAQPTPVGQPDEDPPSRVARLATVEGRVWFYSPDAGEWLAAVRNQPLTNGDRLATDDGARAEIEVGSTTLRLGAGAELEVLAIDDDQLALALHGGSLAARVRDASGASGAGPLTLDTDEGRFVVDRAGSYRFDRGDRVAFATVYAGQARYEGPNSALPLAPGQRAQFWIDANGVAQYSLSAPVNDAFAAWSNGLDRQAPSGVAVRYVSAEMTGADDLDRYGRWEQNADYGALWIPTAVAVGWAPYSTGHWAFVRPWGWTWIDDAPWGFAPFHYGRWVYARNTWCWAPGTRVARPVYAPALVAWIGGPRGHADGPGNGRGPAVGWVPLAPREVFVPGYRSSPRYARNVNFTHVSNAAVINAAIANPQAPRDFGNRRFPNALTVVPAGVLSGRQPVGPAVEQMRRSAEMREFANAPGRGRTLLAPPVAAPPAPAGGVSRGADPRAVRPPPGAAGMRPSSGEPGGGFARPGFSPRDRDAGRPPQQQAQQPQQPQLPQQPPQGLTAPAPAPAAVVAPPAGMNPGATRPSDRPWDRRGGNDADRGSDGRRDGPARPAFGAPAGTPPVAPTTAPPAAVAVEPAPTVRPFPVRRGEDRNPPGMRPPEAQTQAPAQPEPRPAMPPRFQRPEPAAQGQAPAQAPAFVRPPEAARPAEVQRPAQPAMPPRMLEAQRPPEAQRPAPIAPPPRIVEAPRPAEIQRPPQAAPAPQAPQAPQAPTNPRLEQKRNESRDPRDAR